MTVIAWDGKTLASDRKFCCGDFFHAGTKIFKSESGELIGFSGDLAAGYEMLEWYKAGADRKSFPDIQKGDGWSRLVVVGRGSKVFSYENSYMPIPYEGAFCAWGSGGKYAIGAMAMGASAQEAVEVASRFDPACGLGVDTLTLDNKENANG